MVSIGLIEATDEMLTTQELLQEVERLRGEVQTLEQTPNGAPTTRCCLEYTNGDRYEGAVLERERAIKRHGNGQHICANGDIYDGKWQNDRRHGYGQLKLQSGSVVEYNGTWENDQTHGFGVCLYRNGARYEGSFHRDQREGWGAIQFSNGEHYEGEWHNDNIHGMGLVGQGCWRVKSDVHYYEGQFVNGEITKGRHMHREESLEYEGSFLHGVAHGEGILIKDKESRYQGSFKNGQQTGQGICHWETGHCYEGCWKDGLRHGKGQESFRDRCIYQGDWLNNQKHGQGIWMSPSGDRYVGSFYRDEVEGEGVMIYANGDKYKGQWKQNLREGFGKCLYENGDKYKGEWHQDRRHGQGTCRFADGTRFVGRWENNSWIQTAAAPGCTQITGEGLHHAVAGQDMAFTIEAFDENGCKRLSGEDVFYVLLRDLNDNQYFGTVEDHKNGCYTATYKVTISGTYELYILTGEEECVGDSPYALEVAPAEPCLRQSCIDARHLLAKKLDVHQTHSFFVSPRDVYGNPCTNESVQKGFPIEVWLEGSERECLVTTELGIDGHYHCSFWPSESGYYRLFVTSQNRQLPNSPLSIQVGDLSDSMEQAVHDQSQKWAEIVEAEVGQEEPVEEDPEAEFIKNHPDVPVITNLEDVWKLSQLQKERQRRAL